MGITRERPETRNNLVDISTHITDPANNTTANTGSLRALIGRALRQMKKISGEDNWYNPPTWSLKESYNPGNHENIYSFKHVRTVSSTNISPISGAQTVGGVVVTTGMRVLLRSQTAAAENGIYIANTSGAWTRADDLNTDAEFVPSLIVMNQQDGRAYRLSTLGPIVVGTTSLTFTDFPPVASSTVQGISELADSSEAKALTDTTRTMVPARVLDAMHTRAQKPDVRATSTGSNVTTSGAATLDTVVLATGDRVLLRNQTASAQNGIYVVNTAGAWTRASDLDDGQDFLNGVTVRVREGTAGTGAGQVYYLTSATVVTVGTTAITFAVQPAGVAAVADASSTQKGAVQTSVNPVTANTPIVLGVNDPIFDTHIDGCELTWDNVTTVAMEAGALWIPAANKVVNIGTRITLTVNAPGVNVKQYVYAVYNTSTGGVTLAASTTAPVLYSGRARVMGGPTNTHRYVGMVQGNAAGTGMYRWYWMPGDRILFLEDVFSAPQLVLSQDGAFPTTSENTVSASGCVPVTSRTAILNTRMDNDGSSSNRNVALTSPDDNIAYAGAVTATPPLPGLATLGHSTQGTNPKEAFVDAYLTSTQTFTWRSDNSGTAGRIYMGVRGYVEER